ncbi:phenylacetaldoxime dehydratase family protein [Mesorhizobium sp. L-8-3]|uniref:phenylacetaldoxime dehydratase family protein n=1 Tax=Mesorhizobium sp. L-8-3 TaxID=2744522 RepID=UPI0019281643|nr:phenylacetaldoxime dehydratase family protein [Mesorhizobium sp. L-8-3]BCH24263.1 phenylacetaldoxime dehydratase [Mesorhizobium sp. L-8-3]
MEAAIPQHLRVVRSHHPGVARTRHPRVRDDYQPPYPSYVARHKPDVKRVVMAYFGLQSRTIDGDVVRVPLAAIAEAFSAEDGPGHWDRASYIDEANFPTVVSIAYWDDPHRFDRWFARHGVNWAGSERPDTPLGFFTEVLRPSIDRYETLFSSTGRPEGVGALADGLSGMVREHAYWGGMRDRIPLSQTDDMAPRGAPRVDGSKKHRRVTPHRNICLIRSGQDWTDTDDEERRLYLQDVEPVLRAGMDFLRDEGLACGCFANRYMQVLGSDGRPVEKSFGMSWWHSLDALDRWSESHPTHVAIFGAAMKYLSRLGPAAKLRLYHEVTVAAEEEQFFEYFNCHPSTGMLRSAN